MNTTPQTTIPELEAEIVRLNKIVAALVKHSDLSNTERKNDFSIFQAQVMLEDEVQSRTEQLEEALLNNERINKELIEIQYRMKREIDDKKALIEKLEESDRQLRQSEKLASIGQLSAGIAHEINNPMGFITSNLTSLQRYFGELLELITMYEHAVDHPANQELREQISQQRETIDIDFLREDIGPLFDDSIEGATRVKKIIQDLLHFSRSGENSWEWVDLRTGIDSTLNIINNELKYKADVIKHYGAIPAIRCMPAQINQVFMNMLLNAAHAIDIHGEITITTQLESDFVCVSITDSGCGMTPAIQAKIFDPFFTTKQVGAGTGLGLSVAYGIIKKHHGRIEVESVPGKGSTFSVRLPIQQPEPVSAEPVSTPNQEHKKA